MRGRKKHKEPFVTTARLAQGRERTLTQGDPLPLPVQAALDVMARHRAVQEPLDRIAANVSRERHLGPRERRATADLAFSWARHAAAVEQLIDDAVQKERGLGTRRRLLDLCALCLASIAGGVDVDDRTREALPEFLRQLVDDAVLTGLHLPTSLPPWLVQRLEQAFPGQGDTLVRALGQHAHPVLAVDTQRMSIDDVVKTLAGLGVKGSPSPTSPTAVRIDEGRLSLSRLPGAVRATVWPMDDGSQAVAHSVDARPGERVLDLCAGGGGKARVLVQSGAHVTAVDIDAGRLLKSLPRGAQGVVADGTRAPFAPGTFDRVLVDAPCSGTGTLRRAPDLALRLQEADVPPLVALQTSLLQAALSLVKPGGTVVYATCSLLKEENSDVVDAVLAANKKGAVRSAADRYLLPPSTDGFFIARLQRS